MKARLALQNFAKPWMAATTFFLYFDHSAQTLEGEGEEKEGGEEEEGKRRRRRRGGKAGAVEAKGGVSELGEGGREGGGLPRNGPEKFSPPVWTIQGPPKGSLETAGAPLGP